MKIPQMEQLWTKLSFCASKNPGGMMAVVDDEGIPFRQWRSRVAQERKKQVEIQEWQRDTKET